MKIARRQMLKAGLALPALAWSFNQARVDPRRDSSFDPWIEVNPENLRHNVMEVSRRVDGRPILAVIKNNGYGLGLLNVAHTFEPLEPIYGFAVVKLQEAVSLREGGIRKPILCMGPFDDRDLEEMVAREITPMVYTSIGETLNKLSAKFQRQIPLQVCIDTGIGRVGVPFRQAPELVRDLANRKSVRIDGMMMTFTEDPEFDPEQLHRFKTLCVGLEKERTNVGKKHAVSSFGLFQRPDAFLDMVRPGMALFGIYSEKEFRTLGTLKLLPGLSFKARVIYVKQLLKGESAGYNRVFKAQAETWVATIPIGHADGLPRYVTKGASVRIGSGLYRIVAISASHCIADLGRETCVAIADEATIFNWQEGSRPEDVASACEGSVYDLTMHLNPLLPRRIL